VSHVQPAPNRCQNRAGSDRYRSLFDRVAGGLAVLPVLLAASRVTLIARARNLSSPVNPCKPELLPQPYLHRIPISEEFSGCLVVGARIVRSDNRGG